MSIDFSQVKGIKIPQGNVERITIDNTVVWQATRSWKTIQASSDYTIINYGLSGNGIYQNGFNVENRIGSSPDWLPHLYKVNGNNTLIKFTLEKADSSTSTNFTNGSYYYVNTTGNLGIPSTDSPDWEAFEYADTYGEDWVIELDLSLCRNISYTQIPMFVIRSGTNLAGSNYYACSIVAEYDADKDCYYVGLVGSIYGNGDGNRAVIRYSAVSSYNLFGVPALDPGWITIDDTTRTIGSSSTYSNISNFATLPNNISKVRLTLKYTGNYPPNSATYYNTNMSALQDAYMGTTLLNTLLTASSTEFTLEFDYNPNRPYLFVVGGKRRSNSTSRDFYISLKQTASGVVGELNLSLIKSGANEASISSVTPASSYGIYPFSITKIEAYIP